MAEVPGRMKIIVLFVIGSVIVMFADGLVFDNYNARPSMALMHMEMEPVIYNDPAPPSLDDYWARFQLFPTHPSDPDAPMVPDIVMENGTPVKVFRIFMQNSLHEIRPGVKVPMFTFNGQVPAPTIRVTEGDRVRVVLVNNGTDPHTIHWHGINNISDEFDGVPDVTQDAVQPGGSFTYDFTAGPSGTKMYHCHVEAPHHITLGMFGALIVDPSAGHGGVDDGDPFNETPAAEHVLIFNEFDTHHNHITFPGDMMPSGPDAQLPWLLTPGRKFMMPFDPDLNEFLINGKAFPATAPIVVKEGDVVRLRLLNLGLVEHSIHVHGHAFVVTHRDGFRLPAPFTVDTLSIAPGERYDVWFKADNPGVWMLHDHAGMSAMDNGFDPGGIMTVIKYENVTNDAYERFLQRAAVYRQDIDHMDQDHGMLTPSSPPEGSAMEGMGSGMEGMAMGGGH